MAACSYPRRMALASFGALVLATMAAESIAGVPTVMNFQGRLTDNTPMQAPINASLPMEFRIYDQATGGLPLWSETWTSVPVVNGLISVLLGSNGSPLPASVFTSMNLHLEIIVDGDVLTPRQKIGAVPYAAWAKHSEDTPFLQADIAAEAAARVAGDAAAVTSASVYTDSAIAAEAAARVAGDAAAVTSASVYTDSAVSAEAAARASEDQVLHNRIDNLPGGGGSMVDVVPVRPSAPATGSIIFNTATGSIEVFDGQFWQTVSSLPAGDCFPNSALLNASQKHQINTWAGDTTQKWQLCYRRSMFGASGSDFHSACDNLGPTVTLVRMNGDLRLLGGFSDVSWQSTTGWVGSNRAFLFSLSYNQKYPIDPSRSQFAIYNNATYGPTFGGGFDFHILPNMTAGYCFFSWSYVCDGLSGVSDPDCYTRLCGSYNTWTIEEVEVFYAVPGGCGS